jgi:hypothetical protein
MPKMTQGSRNAVKMCVQWLRWISPRSSMPRFSNTSPMPLQQAIAAKMKIFLGFTSEIPYSPRGCAVDFWIFYFTRNCQTATAIKTASPIPYPIIRALPTFSCTNMGISSYAPDLIAAGRQSPATSAWRGLSAAFCFAANMSFVALLRAARSFINDFASLYRRCRSSPLKTALRTMRKTALGRK